MKPEVQAMDQRIKEKDHKEKWFAVFGEF